MASIDRSDGRHDTRAIDEWRAIRRPSRSHRRRAEALATAAFAGGSAAVFVVLAGCVMAAVVFYYQYH